MNVKNEIVLYQPNNSVNLEVRLENETVWLTQAQIGLLFGVDRTVITKHLKNIFESGELPFNATCAKIAQVQKEGNRTVSRQIEFYNLDAILSIGYRVNSFNATLFRKWANNVLKDYVLRGYAICQRFEHLEYRVTETEKKIDFFVKTALPPIEGIFYDGQIFDAYKFVSDLIKMATKSIVLIDNYVDDSVLVMLTKRTAGVDATIYTSKNSAQLQLDLTKHNAQYPPITINENTKIHDRFLLIDKNIYTIGASLKDLGKKLFAFTKMGMRAEELMRNISEKNRIKNKLTPKKTNEYDA
ncbi:DNA-binding protein [Bacteroidia bacterium]|nr:DNA-binding protein [Bacteroidia bacterium]